MNDNNIWNDKNTEDYLRWVKKETFSVSIHITFLLCCWSIGIAPEDELNKFGPISFMPNGLIIWILFLQHGAHIVTEMYMMVIGQTKKWLTVTVFMVIIAIKIVVVISVLAIYFAHYDKELIQKGDDGKIILNYNVHQVIFIHMDVMEIAIEIVLGIRWIINAKLKEKKKIQALEQKGANELKELQIQEDVQPVADPKNDGQDDSNPTPVNAAVNAVNAVNQTQGDFVDKRETSSLDPPIKPQGNSSLVESGF